MRDELLRAVNELGAKQRIAFHDKDYQVWKKEDNSIVTEVDHYSHRFLTELLERTGIPVVSEEDESTWQPADEYWLIDPLDGTREFVNNIEEFTINIAHIKDGKPIFGIIHHPMTGASYYSDGKKAYKVVGGQTKNLLIQPHRGQVKILISRYYTPKLPTLDFPYRFIQCGSSLKFPRIAEGLGDVYPRRFNMYQWDTAAGVAIVRGAGGVVITCDGKDLVYGEKIRTPGFVAAKNKALASKALKFLAQ